MRRDGRVRIVCAERLIDRIGIGLYGVFFNHPVTGPRQGSQGMTGWANNGDDVNNYQRLFEDNAFGQPGAEAVSVVGPLCTPLDLLADKMALPDAGPGDLVVVFQSGAYGATASPRGFLSQPDLVEVLV